MSRQDYTINGLVFRADIAEKEKDKIRNELFSCLEAPDIQII